MAELATTLVNGLSLGFIYALLAVGFVVIYKATAVVNFAHGAVMLLGIYVMARVQGNTGFLLAALIGIAVVLVLSLLLERLLIAPLRARGAGHDTALVMTLGINIILTAELSRQMGTTILNVDGPWGGDTVSFLGLNLPVARVTAMIVGVILFVTFFVLLRRTSMGVSMRATAEDPETAALVGIRLGRVSAAAWLVAGGLACVAGIFLTSFPTPGFGPGVALIALNAFPAAVIGGLDSLEGALVGGLIIGVAEMMVVAYAGNLTFLGSGVGLVTPWFVMLLVLLFRPNGLFGVKEAARV